MSYPSGSSVRELSPVRSESAERFPEPGRVVAGASCVPGYRSGVPSDSLPLVKSVGAGSVGNVVEESGRQCTICFGDDVESPGLAWCTPCHCRGTSRWVHQVCILRWVDEKQKKKGLDSVVRCEQCQYPYKIILPAPSLPEKLKTVIDDFVHNLSPFAIFVLGCGGLIHLSFRYGVFCSLVAAGPDATEQWLAATHTPVPVVAMTLTPMTLLGFGMIKWDEVVVRAASWSWARVNTLVNRIAGPKDGPVRRLTSVASETQAIPEVAAADNPVPEAEYSTWIMSSLSLPVISAVCGFALFKDRPWSTLNKSMLGGLAYLMCSGSFRILCNVRNERRRRKRSIQDCPV